MGEIEITFLSYELYFLNGLKNKLRLKIERKDLEPFYGRFMIKQEKAYPYPTQHFYQDEAYCEFMRNRKWREEVERLSKVLKIGQRVKDGVILEDKDFPVVTKQKIDLFFEKIKYIHIKESNILDVQFSPTEDLEPDLFCSGYDFTNGFLSIYLKYEALYKVKTKEAFTLKDFSYSILGEGSDILGYDRMENRKEYPYFCKKFEELMLRVVESKEFKIWRLQKLLQ
ncbi:TPA: hypothetical protein QCW55_005636 [Bacillus cereus]|nr:hypothetical protein [Bacillus cereus]